MNFRTTPIIPCTLEVLNASNDHCLKKYLRKHTISYNSVDEYLERQFFLLREDCFYYLKRAIRMINSSVGSLNRIDFSDSNVWVYFRVKINVYSFSNFEIVHEIQFKLNPKDDGFNNKQLKFGSLLFLSCDRFESYFVATVAESNEKDLKKGLVRVKFIDYPIIPSECNQREFCMIEMQTYFESYIHVLRRLQTITEFSFPFPDYFLKNKTRPKIPEHLEYENINVKCDNSFNESQRIAFKSALTQNISVIQGPPGTGKSTLGSAILKKIFENNYRNQKPILVICYTNHALDQFLEKILDFCPPRNVVRIGSQIESEKIKPCSIGVHRDQWISERKFPKSVVYEICQVRNELNSLKSDILKEDKKDSWEFVNLVKSYEILLKQYKNLIMEEHQLIMESAQVIGMTTTACARYAEVIENLEINVVIIEEAAEILEAHVVCSLGSFCKQLIMIGDQQQLQPSASVYEYNDIFDFDCSLFERLIDIGFKYVTLTHQWRMRPEISRCIVPIYPKLENHISVYEYPSVKGFRTNIYFFQHAHPEYKHPKEKSYENAFEVDFVLKICSFLVERGNNPNEITVLSTYRGQSCQISKRLQNIKSCTVDTYQGEENNIIILSLVRSNSLGKVGFLKKENRINVALSRARHGLFIVGNLNCLKKYRLWFELSKILEKETGNSIPITCRRNESHHLIVKDLNDFSRNNLCPEKCMKINNCGKHVCQKTCHDGDHEKCETVVKKMCKRKCHWVSVLCQENVICKFEFTSQLKCGHNANHICSEPVPEYCKANITVELRCSHSQQVVCGTDISQVICNKRYDQILDCGHTYIDCIKYVGLCSREIDFQLLCGHKKDIKCFERNSKLKCFGDCLRKMNCGHTYKHLCDDCEGGKFHKPCKTMIESKLTCGHTKYIICSEKDLQHKCYNICEKKMKCSHFCTYLCVECEGGLFHKPCNEIINFQLSCLHYTKIKCSEKDKLYTCNSICEKRMNCSHICREICKECEGGTFHKPCMEIISYQLPCNHHKQIKCSEKNKIHTCFDICNKRNNCGHICKSICKDCDGGKTHSSCHEIIQHFLPCEHTKLIKCSEKNMKHTCLSNCTKVMACGHSYEHQCYECNGGESHKACNEIILHPLPCGHNKSLKCSEKHLEYVCYEVCLKKMYCGHKCKSLCHDCDGGKLHSPCSEIVKQILICGHKKLILCFEKDKKHICEDICMKKLFCGHSCLNKCIDCDGRCKRNPCITEVNHKLPCEHLISVKCSEKTERHCCPNICGKLLKCGHKCQYPCKECLNGRLHKVCKTKCSKTLKCGHLCKDLCHPEVCQNCTDNCFFNIMKNFRFEVQKQFPEDVVKDWIKLKDSLDDNLPFSVKITLNEIVKHVLFGKYLNHDFKKYHFTYTFYVSLLEFYKNIISTISFDEMMIFKDHILDSISRMIIWISPLSGNWIKCYKEDLEMEYDRIKDIVAVCQMKEKRKDHNQMKYLEVLNDLIDARYDEEVKYHFKQKITFLERQSCLNS